MNKFGGFPQRKPNARFSRPIKPETSKSVRRRNFLISFLYVSVTLFCVVYFIGYCRVKTIVVENNAIIDSGKIIEDSGIVYGTHMYSVDKEKIEHNILKANPYIKSAKVKRILPGKLKITVEEDKPDYFIVFSSEYFLISNGLRVLEKVPDYNTAVFSGAALLNLSGIYSAEVGDYLVFENDGFEFYLKLLGLFEDSELDGNITSADLSVKYNINIVYKSKYTIVFGNIDSLDKKIKMCYKTISYLEKNMPGVAGKIYATSSEETSFQITGTADTAE